MIIRLNSEANLVKATEVKLIKTSDYQDTLTFKLPLDEQIFVDELVGVRTKVMKQDYRVKEIITKDRFKDVYCEHKFFDCKNIVIPFIDEAHRAGESYNDFSRYNSLQSIVAHLNRIMRTKGDTEFKFSTDIDKSGVVECDDTPLFDLIFGEKGILKTFNVELVYDNYKVKFVAKRPSKNTEILFHENKNVSELQETIDFKGIITKLHVTCKYTPDKTEEGKAERERLRAEKRRELFNKSQEKIKAREERQAQERALRRQKQEEAYQASRTAPKKTREQIHAEHLQKQQETENRISANNVARRQAREQKFNEREQQRVSKKQDKDDLIFRTVFVSPLVNRYARPYEASLNFQSSEINSEEALIAWCNANLFTDEDTRDVPLRNFSFKPVEDDYNVDINDKAMVNFTSIDTRKIVHCCKIEYDALHDKYLNIEFGVLNKSAIRETIGALNAKISETNSNISRTYDILDNNFDIYVQKELEAYSELFNIDKGEIEDTINQGFEDMKIEAEKVYGNINTDIENKLAPIREEVRTTVEAYNQQLQATKLELENNRTTSLEQLKELTNKVNNVQDISTNPTVIELKQQVAEAKESGNVVKSKVTELEGSITREFTSVKSKAENDLNVVKAEFTKGVDGLTRKISSLEEYKNQDGSRTESLKQWVQRDTASQLSRERTEITRIVDEKGYVKNTEFSSKFNDNAQGINRKLDALETYKNEDGTRTSALKQWAQENTASQLATERRSIESWVDNKGYVTTSVVNNKVQETANSFSREIQGTTNSINELNSWKQTTNQTLNTVSRTLDDTVRHSQLQITADSINFGSNKVFNGKNLASMLTVSPDSIKAITDRLVISPANENLVLPEHRDTFILNVRNGVLNRIYGSNVDLVGEYQFKVSIINFDTPTLHASIHVKYKDGTDSWFNSEFPIPSIVTLETSTSVKVQVESRKEIEYIEPLVFQNKWSDFYRFHLKKLFVGKKKSAELIVDGTIEGKHIKSSTIETGHHKAGSITSEIIAANAVKAKHVLIDDGLINNLITHKAFINKLWTQDAFIKNLSAVKIKSTQIDTDTLNGVVISGQSKIKIGQYGFLQPISKGLQINAPENFGSKRGIGLQIVGEGVGPKDAGVPPGLFIYEDPDFTKGNTVPNAVNRVLLTVAGMACFSSRISGSIVKGQPILTNLESNFPFSAIYPVKFIGYQEGGFMRFFGTDKDDTNTWNIKVDTWGSDRKLKTDIKESEFTALEFVEKLNFKEHGWNKDEIGYERPHTKCGLIAQELQELDESLVVDYGKYLGLDGLRLINISLKAAQELSIENKELKQRIIKLEEKVNG